jgi:peptidoglycan/xylan/chitin deacetylase (PgdA/CDA1 family)
MSDVLVLCYHAVSEQWDTEYAVDPETLERQLRFLIDSGYRGATFSDSVIAPPSPKTCAVTFDDAFRSIFELALPVLSRLGLPGTVFACTDFVGQDGPMPLPGLSHWIGTQAEDELRCTSWQQLADLAGAGWEIGSHTASHPRLTQLGDRELADELQRSKARCEQRLGLSCKSLAYPHGDVDARVVEAARGAGYLSAAGVLRDTRNASPLLSPRLAVYRDDGLLRFRIKCLPAARRLRRSRAWPAARPAHALMRVRRRHEGRDVQR